jgi:hypothetical protein
MTDRRELILSRIEEILQGIDLAANVYRNKEDLTENMQPCFVLFDAHEEKVDIGEMFGMQSLGRAIVRMTPRIGVYVAGLPEDVGPQLNEMRLAALKAIFNDSTLLSTITLNGDIVFEGCATALDRGAEMVGEMILSIGFVYPLNPSEF